MKIDELMTTRVETCKTTDALDVPARQMRDQGCGCVVVVDDARKPVAVVTDRDICMCALRTMSAPHRLRVAQAMSPWLATCRSGIELAEAERIMRSWHVRRLPVVDGSGVLVGILSLDDLAWAAARSHGLLRPAVTSAEVGATLAEVAHPRVIIDPDGRSG